jgi:helicase
MMKFTSINPKARVVLLSATLPNVEEVAEWLSYVLNKKKTVLIRSEYRPCKLNMHWEKYDDSGYYAVKERAKVELAMDIIEHYPEDKFIVFAHTKGTGKLMREALEKAGIPTDFHNADLTKQKRLEIEKSFKGKGGLRVIVATSTLAAGINMPARRVIVLGVHRGILEVDPLDVIQECGRAGRPAYDLVGDAYVLLPESDEEFAKHSERLRNLPPVRSRMLERSGKVFKILAFHIVSEIFHKNVKTREDVLEWFSRSLAHFQSNKITKAEVGETLEALKKCGAVTQEGLNYAVTGIGKVASMFYYSPFDVANYKKNIDDLIRRGHADDDVAVAYALANIDSNYSQIASKAERDQFGIYAKKLSNILPGAEAPDGVMKAAFSYYTLLSGSNCEVLAGYIRQLQGDFPRVSQMLQSLDPMSGRWGKIPWIRELALRMTYGVHSRHVPFCHIPHVGKARAEKLYLAGARKAEDLMSFSDEKLKSILGVGGDKLAEVRNYIGRQCLLS